MSEYVGKRRASGYSDDETRADARRRRIRTTFQVTVAAAPVLLVAVPYALKHLEATVPPEVYAVLAGAGAVIVAVASFITKVMNNPAVAGFIERRLPWLAAQDPEPEPTVLDQLREVEVRDKSDWFG
ncbi:hypothetical protein [Micromonospora sp. NBC_01813]|uniref:hypothetical protein n=1 Tax=Micromonospora sp. NBC_01813 TaxID=2975988 RepID=UPI002DD9E6B9|nr:hypothetical protein [Micromonospora sp. NBC_01813]WSA11563.1 hypothetical protein OG958_12710 [Micromonospora sp. NBC_01813]